MNTSSSLLTNEPPLQILPTLALRIGLKEAIVLQQMHYWLNPKFCKNTYEGKLWVHNTYEQWGNQFPFWGQKTIRRTIQRLEKANLINSFLKVRGFKKTKFYTINYDHPDVPKRADRRGQSDPMEMDTMTTSYKEAENTHENTPSFLPSMKKNEEEEENKFQKYFDVWNKTVHAKLKPNQKIHLTEKRLNILAPLLERFFQNDLERWKAYCTQISNCKFLMGGNKSGFKVTFDWAVKPDNVVKILEGSIYDQSTPLPEPKQQSWPEFDRSVRDHITQNSLPPLWFHIIQMMAPTHGRNAFESWLKDLDVTIDLKTVKLTASTVFIKDRVESLFGHDLELAFAKLLGIEEIIYDVSNPPSPS